MRALAIAVTVINVTVLAQGCGYGDGAVVDLPVPDAESFGRDVQDVLGQGCGTLDCHGDPERPFRLYSVYGLRHTGALRGEDLTAAEVGDNAATVIAIGAGRTDERHLALTKPLSEAAGGLEHVGGDLWPSTDDSRYRALADWLAAQASR